MVKSASIRGRIQGRVCFMCCQKGERSRANSVIHPHQNSIFSRSLNSINPSLLSIQIFAYDTFVLLGSVISRIGFLGFFSQNQTAMVYDSIANALIPTAASNPKEFGKKKRVNRTAKLKQSKLDVRREQWLSQVKNKGFKEENKGAGRLKTPLSDMHASNEGENRVMVKLVINPGGEGEENDDLMNHYSDLESPSNSPTSHSSSLTSNRSVTNFTGSSSRSSSSSSASASGGCYSGSMTEEDDGDDGCLDDWEAIADALAADEIKSDNNNLNLEPQVHDHDHTPLEPVETIKQANRQAWRPDDAFRPQGLPNLLKQNSFPMNLERNHGGFKNAGFTPTTCPICCEDLDLTDSSFLPCPCGYRLCLFCYKRILEDNGRCPGCRKQYEQSEQGSTSTASKLARSYSMIPRH